MPSALLAMGVPPDLARTAIRLTFAEPLDERGVDRVLAALRAEVLRAAALRSRR